MLLLSSDVRVPCSTRSTQALAMPCKRSSLSAAVTSRMTDLLGAHACTQLVVAVGVGQRQVLLTCNTVSTCPGTGVAVSRPSTLSTCGALTAPLSSTKSTAGISANGAPFLSAPGLRCTRGM